MKNFIALAAIAAACSTSAFAQVSNFIGPSVGGNVDFKSTTIKVSSGGAEFSGLGRQTMIGSLTADYGLQTSSNSVLLVGMKADLGKTSIAKISGSGQTVELSETGHLSAFVAPGFLLSDKTLAYAKLSYESAKAELTDGTTTKNQNINGFGYGVGVRAHIQGDWFLNVEAGRIDYKSKSVGSADATTGTTYGSVGVSYKF